MALKKGVQIGLFQEGKAFQVVNKDTQEDTTKVESHVCSVQEDLELGRKFQNRLNSTSCLDLQQEQINMLLKHKKSTFFVRGKKPAKTSDKTQTRNTTNLHSIIQITCILNSLQ